MPGDRVPNVLRGDICVEGSRQWRFVEDQLIKPALFQNMREAGTLPVAVPENACTPSANAARLARWAACSAASLSCTSKPTSYDCRDRGSGRNRISGPGSVEPLLAAPGTSGRLIHCSHDVHRLQPRRCRRLGNTSVAGPELEGSR
jgi:hypothetical protein